MLLWNKVSLLILKNISMCAVTKTFEIIGPTLHVLLIDDKKMTEHRHIPLLLWWCPSSFCNNCSSPTNHGEGGGGCTLDGGATFDFSVSSASLDPRVLPSEERVNLRRVLLIGGYKVMMELRDQSTRGEILFRTALRNRMYIHGSRIWFQVAKRSQSSRYLTWSLAPDSTVCAMKIWQGRNSWKIKIKTDKWRNNEN